MPIQFYRGKATHETLGVRDIELKIVNARPDAERAAVLFLNKHPQFKDAEFELVSGTNGQNKAMSLKKLLRTEEENQALASGTRQFKPSGRDAARSAKVTREHHDKVIKDSLTRAEDDTRPLRNNRGETTVKTSVGKDGTLG
jgi:hypothetical protein